MITVILLSWKRKKNILQIIESIRNQTISTEIWLINNNGFEDFGADRLIAIPWNAGEWARYVIAGRVETDYTMFQDDDFMLGDNCFLEDALQLHQKYCPEYILGVAGRGLQRIPPYYWPDIINQDNYVHILKGHFQLFRSSVVRKSKIPQHPSASDIYWSLDVGNGQPKHYVSKDLSNRLIALKRYGVGYEFRSNHLTEREEVCEAWLQENV